MTGRKLYLKRIVPAGPTAQRQAERIRDDFIRQVDEGRQPRTNAPLSQLIERHLATSTVEPRTRTTLTGYLRKHVVPFLGDRAIGSVRVEDIESLYAQLRRCREHCTGGSILHRQTDEHRCDSRCRRHTCRPLAASTIRKIHYLISGAYQDAIRWDWIAASPLQRVRKPPPAAADPQPPSAEEAAALVAEAWRWDLGPFVWLAMTTGARRGELCALRWRDLQAHHAAVGNHDCAAVGCRWWLVIRRSIGQDGNRFWETDTKTHQRRHVALDPQTLAVLAEHRHQCEREAAQLGYTLTGEHFVFAGTADGATPTMPSAMTQRYSRCAKRLGIRTTLKNLRHYSATELITAGVDIRTVAGRLGHSGGGTTTLKVYAAWVAAADQHASTVLMNRMPPQRATTSPPRLPVTGPASASTTERTIAHERIAAILHQQWLDGRLAPGFQLKVKTLSRDHSISVGTAHSVLACLDQMGVVRLRTGRPTVVNACQQPSVPQTTCELISNQGTETSAGHEASETPNALPVVSSEAHTPRRCVLTLDLFHLGVRLRTMRAQADPDDFETLQKLLLDAVRRVGNDRDQIGDYELVVRLAGQGEPYTIVVAAA